MFSGLNSTAASPQERAPIGTPLTKPFIPDLKPLKPNDYGISKDAQKKLSLDPERYCDNLNRGWTDKWSEHKERIETIYKKQFVFKEIQEVVKEIEQDLNSLGAPGISKWDQRVAEVRCSQGGGLGNSYVKITCNDGVALTTYALDIRSIPSNPSEGLRPISSPGLSNPIDWPPGNLIINGIQIPIKAKMSLASVLLAINQSAKGTLSVSYIIIQQPTNGNLGIFKLSFQPYSPQTSLVFDDDQSGQILQALGFQSTSSPQQDSVILLNGTEIRRPSLVLTDVIPGITLELLQQTPPNQEHFLTISVGTLQTDIETLLSHLCEKLRQFHQLVIFHAPSSPPIEGLLKDVHFLKQMDQEILALFRKGFGPPDIQGRQDSPADFGLEIFENGALFNPVKFKKAILSPQSCRIFLCNHLLSIPQTLALSVFLQTFKDKCLYVS